MDKWMLAVTMAQLHKGSAKDLEALALVRWLPFFHSPPSFFTRVVLYSIFYFFLLLISIPARQYFISLPPVAPFVGPVGTASCCTLRGARQRSLTTTVDVP